MIADAQGQPYTQDPPNCIQVEPSEGCTIACRFCSIRALTPGPNSVFKFMDMEVAAALGERIKATGWNPRIEFAMHGEPTAHPDLSGLVRTLRSYLPTNYFLLTTNGTPLIADRDQASFEAKVEALYAAGIDTIALDAYRGLKVHEYARRMERPWLLVGDYPADTAFNPHPRRSRKAKKLLSIVQDISYADGGTHAHLSNQGGTAGPKDPSFQGRPCALPFRELSVRWDGSIAICCNDWRGKFKLGTIVDTPLLDIWHHPAMYAARKKLVKGERDFGVCDGCNHLSYRVGLLPDRKGQRTLPQADAEDLNLIEMALAGDPYSPGVLRVWEAGIGRPQPGNIGGRAVMVDENGLEVVK